MLPSGDSKDLLVRWADYIRIYHTFHPGPERSSNQRGVRRSNSVGSHVPRFILSSEGCFFPERWLFKLRRPLVRRLSFSPSTVLSVYNASVELEHEHTPDAIADRIASSNHNYIRDFIYGGIDGAVTTFAIVSGVSGAELSPAIVLILGFANLVADGFSMAASNYLGTKAEIDDYRRLEKIEYRHIEVEPEGERQEVRQIYSDKGFEGEELEKAVELITADKDRWVKTMLTEEYGLPSEIRSPWIAAFATFVAFVICGLVPLVPYLFGAGSSFLVSCVMTGVTFFLIGSVKARWSTSGWLRSGIETFLVGSLAAAMAYAVGVLLKDIAG